jgi:hypothetical protein
MKSPKTKIKGNLDDLKPALQSLKSLMETTENLNPGKADQYELQELDLQNIREKGISNNH